MTDSIQIKCPFIPKNRIHLEADKLRNTLWSRILPVEIEYIVEKIGLDINPIKDLRELDIDALLRMNRKEIIVDHSQYIDDRYSNRLRFSLAHETGHYILHSKAYARLERLKLESIEDYLKNFIDLPENEHKNFEYQANEFAGRLLVPIEELLEIFREEINAMSGNIAFSKMYKIDPKQTLDRMSPKICKRFGVSDSVISMRIDREDIISRLADPEISL